MMNAKTMAQERIQAKEGSKCRFCGSKENREFHNKKHINRDLWLGSTGIPYENGL